MPGLILPPHVAPQIEQRDRFLLCTVPGCDKRFPLEQETNWVRHTKACSKRNADEIERVIAEGSKDFITSVGDKELYRHLRRGGT